MKTTTQAENVENHTTENVETNQPEIHVDVREEENADESDKLEELEAIETNNTTETEVENHATENVETNQPEIHVDVREEDENVTGHEELPMTGSKSNYWIVLLGVLMMFGLLFKRRILK
ncbi:collagen adhesin protein [Weissella ceti NC36]|uniref:LPXTG cell wall anchor domain-containing protein n=1 Tax=Weissella ceti TaxID=759620 RepID=UPI0002AA65F8|nr:LPXTG cell wall anchor domain-containing protein [Weissella ceti]ELA07798.1 collagen adhesin protein [Weissella ceti NC36]